MSDLKSQIKAVVDRKKKEDPVGFQRAEKSDELPSFLAADLKAAGISKASYLRATGQAPEPPTNFSDDFEKYVTIISDGLDDNLFDPYYQTHLASNHVGLAESIQSFRTARKIDNRLKTIKVATAIVSLLSFAFAIRTYTRGNFLYSIGYFFLSADLLRVSYNCYIKKYVSSAINMLGGDAKKLTETIFKIAKSAVGITEPGDDPLLKLKYDVLYEVLAEDTLSKLAYNKVVELLNQKKLESQAKV